MGKCENAKIIKLRKLEPSDLPFLYQWENDASVWADGSNRNPLSQQDLRDYIESTTGDIYKDGQLRLVIHSSSESVCQQSGLSGEAGLSSISPQDGLTLGCIDLFDFDPRNRRAAIGMYLAPQYRGQGIGREAVRLLEEYAFGFLHLRIIYAIISTSNTACSELYRQAGYTPSSVLPSWTLEADAVLWFKQAS